MIDSGADRRRRRELAADDRAAVWTRHQVRAQRWHVVRANWRSFAGMLGVAGLAITGVAFLIPTAFAKGLFVGIASSIAIGSIAYLTVTVSGTVAPAMGATAETWTSSELRRLRKHGWLVVNGLPLERRDVDHVLVGPSGVIVVESKWSAYGWNVDPPSDQVKAAANQVLANARTLRLWRELRAAAVSVHPAVCLWGGGREDAPTRPLAPVQLSDGVTVAYGLVAVREWVNSLIAREESTLAETQIDIIWRALEKVVRERERSDRSAAPPASIDRILWTAVFSVLAFTGSMLSSLELFVATRSWWIWTAGSTVLLSASLVARRWRAARYPAIASLLGVAVVVALAAVAAVVFLFR